MSNNKKVFIYFIGLFIFFIGMLLIATASALPIYVKPIDGSGNLQPSTSFDYIFNFTTGADCSGVVLSNSSTIVTGKDGIGFIDIDISGISPVPSYLCEYVDGSLRETHTLSDQLFRDIYAEDILLKGNLTLGQKITFTLGEIIDNIVDGWVRITGGLNVSDSIIAGGNVTAEHFIGNGSQLTGISEGNLEDDGTYLLATGDTATGNYTFDGTTFHIDSTNHKVGIGTTTPRGKLNIDSSTSAANMLELSRTSTGHALKILNYNGNNQTFNLQGTHNNWTNTYNVMAIGVSGVVGIGYSDLTGANGTLLVNGKVGIGTTSPTLGKLQVNGSASGISIYATNNISAEDYLYHSPFTTSSKEQALTDILKIKGTNGKINHSTLPTDAVSILEKPIYEIIITEEERTKEICEEILIKETTELTDAEYKTKCHNKTYFENVTTQNQIGTESEPQTSTGILISKLILSIQKLFEWNTNQDNYLTEQETRIKLLEDELCKKDNSYKFCKVEVVK